MTLYITIWKSLGGLSIYNDPTSNENYEDRVQLTFPELQLQKPLTFPDKCSEKYVHIKRRMKLK